MSNPSKERKEAEERYMEKAREMGELRSKMMQSLSQRNDLTEEAIDYLERWDVVLKELKELFEKAINTP